MTHPVYLDNAATTPMDPRVVEAMLPHLGGRRGNPSSLHASGSAAREVVEGAREPVAALINASPEEIVFTGGGTESDNLAVLGLARAASAQKRHAVVSRVEHAAVRESARRLEAEGWTPRGSWTLPSSRARCARRRRSPPSCGPIARSVALNR